MQVAVAQGVTGQAAAVERATAVVSNKSERGRALRDEQMVDHSESTGSTERECLPTVPAAVGRCSISGALLEHNLTIDEWLSLLQRNRPRASAALAASWMLVAIAALVDWIAMVCATAAANRGSRCVQG